jgi:hypothetical protein
MVGVLAESPGVPAPPPLEAPPPTGAGLAALEVHAATARTAVARRVRTRVRRIEISSEV